MFVGFAQLVQSVAQVARLTAKLGEWERHCVTFNRVFFAAVSCSDRTENLSRFPGRLVLGTEAYSSMPEPQPAVVLHSLSLLAAVLQCHGFSAGLSAGRGTRPAGIIP